MSSRLLEKYKPEVIPEMVKSFTSTNSGHVREVLAASKEGGASLNIMGWVTRSTSDVDIVSVAAVGAQGKITLLPGKPLPPRFTELVAEVGRELGIRQDWLNFGPGSLLDFGLPPGLESRLERKNYGSCLTLHVVSRMD